MAQIHLHQLFLYRLKIWLIKA